ncbi:MAG TPA: methyltransferase [Fulvivirga sp.]|nr:methyltransferase [Fulvivirga sp.]
MEEPRTFQFKQFKIIHQQSAMKVGTDGVLLGAWVNLNNAKRILDVGTGSGLIALMAAQKNDRSLIDAIDNESGAVKEAQLNIAASPWPERINAHHISLQQFNPPYLYDHIMSNPPFFKNGSASPLVNRHNARHTNTLNYGELLCHSARLLHANGKLSLIAPSAESDLLKDTALKNGLHIIRKATFASRENKKPVRVLLCFSKDQEIIEEEHIIHYNDDNSWSEQYRELTRNFYIK